MYVDFNVKDKICKSIHVVPEGGGGQWLVNFLCLCTVLKPNILHPIVTFSDGNSTKYFLLNTVFA